MRILSLIHRDDAKNDGGSAIVSFSGEEIIRLNNLLHEATKGVCDKRTVLEMARDVKLLNAVIQHGGVDSFDIEALADADSRIHSESAKSNAAHNK